MKRAETTFNENYIYKYEPEKKKSSLYIDYFMHDNIFQFPKFFSIHE